MAVFWRLLSLAIVTAMLMAVTFAPLPVQATSFTTQTASQQANAGKFFQSGLSKVRGKAYEGAIADFTRVILLEGDVAAAYSNRCLTFVYLEAYLEAISDCSQAIALHPREEAYLNRGIAYYQLAGFSKALQDFDSALQMNPASAEGYLNRGISHAELGSPAKALHDLQRAADLYAERKEMGAYHQTLKKIQEIQEEQAWLV